MTKKLLTQRLIGLDFVKGGRDGVYVRRLSDEALLYFMCVPRARSGQVVLEPLIAIENFTLRRLIGEAEPRQSLPRFVHLFLSYTVNSGMIRWSFSDKTSMVQAIDAIMDVLQRGGIPFAERWAPFRAAVDLLRRGFAGDVPWGAVTHPTKLTKSVLENLPNHTDPIH
jgi:hypothetical protein